MNRDNLRRLGATVADDAGSSEVPVPMERARILLVDDDRKFARLLANHLSTYGYTTEVAGDGLTGVRLVTEEAWDLVILDVMLPGLDGFEVLQRIRQVSSVPVIMVTARGDEPDRIIGLEIGADDYVPKTYSSRELLARMRALLRRSRGSVGPDVRANSVTLVIGALRIEQLSHRVFVHQREVNLTPIEYNLLACLALAEGKAKSREQLVVEARDGKAQIQDRGIDVHVSMLRRKLGEGEDGAAGYIRTVRGVGYMLVKPDGPIS